jgi:hypothetical protein
MSAVINKLSADLKFMLWSYDARYKVVASISKQAVNSFLTA